MILSVSMVWGVEQLCNWLNCVRVLKTLRVNDNFHCRHLVTHRTYSYRMCVPRQTFPEWVVPYPLYEHNRSWLIQLATVTHYFYHVSSFPLFSLFLPLSFPLHRLLICPVCDFSPFFFPLLFPFPSLECYGHAVSFDNFILTGCFLTHPPNSATCGLFSQYKFVFSMSFSFFTSFFSTPVFFLFASPHFSILSVISFLFIFPYLSILSMIF